MKRMDNKQMATTIKRKGETLKTEWNHLLLVAQVCKLQHIPKPKRMLLLGRFRCPKCGQKIDKHQMKGYIYEYIDYFICPNLDCDYEYADHWSDLSWAG